MASAILILLWIGNEVSHDQFHAKKERLYVANNRDIYNGEFIAWGSTPKILGPTLKKDYLEVEDAVRATDAAFLFTVGDKHLNLNGYFTDPGFFSLFSFPFLQGNTNSLNGKYTIVLTRKTAIKLFGNEDAMGKIVKIDSTDNFTVTGILKDLPNNTSFDFEYLLPWSYQEKIGWTDTEWENNTVETFVLLKPGVTQASFDAKIKNITINHMKGGDKSTTQVFTQLLSDAYLYNKSENGNYVGGRIERVKLFAIIASFILLIACINFMNLSTARSEKRAKEVGIRKVVGAPKGLLILQFIGESILLAFLSGMIALLIVALGLPAFNHLVDKSLFIPFSSPLYWLLALAFILFTGLLAGSYPALYLSSFQPVKVLKGTFKAGNAALSPWKLLVVMQFTFAIALIICTSIVVHQINMPRPGKRVLRKTT
jgi:putative ABC transport system permease protein